MVTALNTLAKCTPLKMKWAANQARVLEAMHSVKVDDGTVLALGTEVSYTDTDLGYCFFGKVVEIKRNYDAGEGVTYICSDGYRTFAKQPAKIVCPAGTTYKLHFGEGTLFTDVLNKVAVAVAGVIPGGTTSELGATALPLLDKAGQTVDTWLTDILNSTAGGVAYIDPNAGNPILRIIDFYGSASVMLDIGNYAAITPGSGTPLLLERGSFGKSLNQRYKKITIEGAGRYRRYEKQYISPHMEEAPAGSWNWDVRWYINDKYLMKRYVKADGTCGDGIYGKILIGEEPDGRIVEFQNMPYAYDDVRKQWFFWCTIMLVGVSIGGNPVPPQVNGWFDYTVFEGPFLTSQESMAAELANEGELVEFHPEFYVYNSPSLTIDPTALVTAYVAAMYERWSTDADYRGSMAVHVKGLNASLRLGSPITNFSGMRVRQIGYDFVNRSMELEVSNQPIRDSIETLKILASDRRDLLGGWRTTEGGNENNCFQDYQFSVDENCRVRVVSADGLDPEGQGADGNPATGGGGTGGGRRDTWDCMPDGRCIQRQGEGGGFKTEQECRAACASANGWKFIPCGGCNQVNDRTGQFQTQAECQTAHPDPLDGCLWVCYPNETVAGQQCKPAIVGPFATRNDCLLACNIATPISGGGGVESGGIDGSGVGSGIIEDFPSGSGVDWMSTSEITCTSGVVTGVVVDMMGHLVDILCASGVGAGYSGTVKVVCGLECSSSDLVIKYTTLTYVNGLLTACSSECTGGCA